MPEICKSTYINIHRADIHTEISIFPTLFIYAPIPVDAVWDFCNTTATKEWKNAEIYINFSSRLKEHISERAELKQIAEICLRSSSPSAPASPSIADMCCQLIPSPCVCFQFLLLLNRCK